MKSYKFFKTLGLLPSSYKHVKRVTKQLKETKYENILSQEFTFSQTSTSINNIVKSYFWASHLISRNHCLARSIALYQYLSFQGYDVEHKFGVNKSNNQFKAHAWVEYQGKPLNEHPQLRQRFRVLEKQ